MKHYNYIFAGAGLSALMTVYKMVKSEKFSDKTILLLDENPKKTNDRTWCFWEEKNKTWDAIVTKKWNSALFANENQLVNIDLTPNKYNQIRSIDFYDFVLNEISRHDNIKFENQKIVEFEENEDSIVIKTETDFYFCDQLFNSILNPFEVENQKQYPLLQQHFIGWFIKSDQEVFNSEQATFMDFSVEQKGNTRFMYVLPTSKTEALLEYTLFSHSHLETKEYESEIEIYLKRLGVTNYKIVEKERGSIPMTCFPFWKNNTKRLLNIGSAGGWTKASTGYTFKNADKKSTQLIQFLQTKNDFRQFHKINKFWFYDLLLLDILNRTNEMGSRIFSALFTKPNPQLNFKFLDEETNFAEDLQVIWKCPKPIFIRAFFRVFLKI
jgi:lycopene cyclase-like protein